MAELPANPTAAAIMQHLRARHRELAKQLEGLDEAGLNWRPGTGTNSIYEILTHSLDTERDLTSSVAGDRVQPDHHFDVQGTQAQATERLARAGQDLETYLSSISDGDMGRELEVFNRPRTVASSLALALSHSAEHVGHIQLTRQMWEQHGNSATVEGTKAS